ncbi:hypothetical protein [Bradyrhizobium sp. HKCCYLS20291]|uniref:hypothetical protein n=1 Tax=Bradyrhizobium sp. HKCCYLS20291 TaxID=3420766 RepID=UPI003EBA7189
MLNRRYLSVMDGAAMGLRSPVQMELHSELLRAILFSEVVVIPDIFFFINFELYKVLTSPHHLDVALKQLFLDALRSGIIRPTLRLGKIDASFSSNLRGAVKDGSNGIVGGADDIAKLLDDSIRNSRFVFETWPTDEYNGGLQQDSFHRAVIEFRNHPLIQRKVHLADDIDNAFDHAMKVRPDALARAPVYDAIAKKYIGKRYENVADLLARCKAHEREPCREALAFFSEAYHQSQAARIKAVLQTPGSDLQDAAGTIPNAYEVDFEASQLVDSREVPTPRSEQLLEIPTPKLLALRDTDEAKAYFAVLSSASSKSADVTAQELAECTYRYLVKISTAYLETTQKVLPISMQYVATRAAKLRDDLKPPSSGLSNILASYVADGLCDFSSMITSQVIRVIIKHGTSRRRLERKVKIPQIRMDALANRIMQSNLTRQIPLAFTLHQLGKPETKAED